MWRYIVGFPIGLYSLVIVLLLTVVRTEGPKFYIAKDEKEKAIEAIHKIY